MGFYHHALRNRSRAGRSEISSPLNLNHADPAGRRLVRYLHLVQVEIAEGRYLYVEGSGRIDDGSPLGDRSLFAIYG